MSNILNFPKNRIVRAVPSKQKQKRAREERLQEVEADIQECCEAMYLILVNEYDIDPNGESFNKNFGWVLSAIRNCMLEGAGFDSDLSKILSKVFKEIKEDSKVIVSLNMDEPLISA